MQQRFVHIDTYVYGSVLGPYSFGVILAMSSYSSTLVL